MTSEMHKSVLHAILYIMAALLFVAFITRDTESEALKESRRLSEEFKQKTEESMRQTEEAIDEINAIHSELIEAARKRNAAEIERLEAEIETHIRGYE